MASNTTSEIATLTRLLNTPGLVSLPIKVVIQGEIQLEVNGPRPLDRINVLLDGGVVTDLFQVVRDFGGLPSWLNGCTDLYSAVQRGWIDILNQQPAQVATPQQAAQPNNIPSPASPQVGDLLVFTGSSWDKLPAGPTGQVLTSNGPGFLPNYQPAGGGGGGGGVPQITGQVTTGLTRGDVCYLSAPNTWSKANAASILSLATSGGVYSGTDGILDLTGSVVAEIRCTADGGQPDIGHSLFLATASADGGGGAGKVSAIPPSPPLGGTVNLQIVGICVDNSNYATFKVVKAIFQPSYPTILVGD
jgi:hypothetical protein